MPGYSKSDQIGKQVNPKKKKADGTKISRTQEWETARAKLKVIYMRHKITTCEYTDEAGKRCGTDNHLSFAHRNKRNDLEPGDLGNINETLLICIDHHQMIEGDKEETSRLFELLRPV